MIKMYDENPNSQKNVYNNLARVNYIDPKNTSHYIVAYKCTPEKTYFKIRTNPGNPTIVSSILAGRQPAFSIRTRGDFENSNGVTVATGLEVITIDYVSNPANATSTAMRDFKAVEPGEMKEIDLELFPRTGTESVSFDSFLKHGEKLMYNPELVGLESISNMVIVSNKNSENNKKDFDTVFNMSLLNF